MFSNVTHHYNNLLKCLRVFANDIIAKSEIQVCF